MLLLVAAGATTTMVATAAFLVTLDRYLQVNTLARLFTAVALDVRGAILAHGPTVLTLRNRPPLLVDVLERTIVMLAVAHTMAPNTGLASPLFTVDKHGC